MSFDLILCDAFKKATDDQDKIISPEETVRVFKEKAASINVDILEKTARIDNGRIGIPVFFSVCGKDAKSVTGTNKQMGKGATPAQAEASAVMELAERFSFFSFRNNDNNFLTDTYRNIENRAVSYELIAKSVQGANSREADIAREFFIDLPFQWTWAFNLTKKKNVLIPFDWFFMINEFNGASAGNCKEEAICQGISEVVERHVSSIISQKKLSVPRIDTETSKDTSVREMLDKYKKNGIEIVASDFSLDTGIPTVAVLGWDPSSFPEKSEIVWTAGTAPDPEKALSRALSEVAQLAGDFNSGSNYIASGLPKFRKLDDAGFIINEKKVVTIKDLPDLSDENIRTEVERYVETLDKLGFEVLVIETTEKNLDIPSFYTIIPGAHFRERAVMTNMAMFTAKFITENLEPFEALPKLRAMAEKLPEAYYIQFYMGQIYMNMENFERAATRFDNAMKLNPDEQDIPSICSYTGVCLKEMERYNEALEILEKGISFDDEREDIFNLMGFCHFKLKNHKKAIDCFQRVIDLNPSSAIDYANIASNYRDMGEKDKAIKYYSLALAIDDRIDFAKDNLKKLKGNP